MKTPRYAQTTTGYLILIFLCFCSGVIGYFFCKDARKESTSTATPEAWQVEATAQAKPAGAPLTVEEKRAAYRALVALRAIEAENTLELRTYDRARNVSEVATALASIPKGPLKDALTRSMGVYASELRGDYTGPRKRRRSRREASLHSNPCSPTIPIRPSRSHLEGPKQAWLRTSPQLILASVLGAT